jgi:phage terminase large subunit
LRPIRSTRCSAASIWSQTIGKSGFSPPPASIVREINYEDNKWFPDVLRTELEFVRSRDVDKYNHIWLGRYRANSEARVFKNWRIEAFDSARRRIPAGRGLRLLDRPVMRDPLLDRRRTIYVDYEAWGLQVEIVNLPTLFMTIPMRRSSG